MTTICPKCRTPRAIDTSAPDWQCPSCGVANAKAGDIHVAHASIVSLNESGGSHKANGGFSWGGALMAAAIAYGCWVGFNHAVSRSGGGAISSINAKFGGDASAEQLAALGATTVPGDVVMYGTSWCPYCAAARKWMNGYGFKYEDCDIEASHDCAQRLKSAGGGTGVPYLVVRGHHMKDGFDSDEFIAALQKK